MQGFLTFPSIQVLFVVCSPDLLMSELDSIRVASLHAVPPHHDQRRVGVRRLVLVQRFYCVTGRPRPLWGSRSQCGSKLSQLHQSEFRDLDHHNCRQLHTQNFNFKHRQDSIPIRKKKSSAVFSYSHTSIMWTQIFTLRFSHSHPAHTQVHRV